MFIKCLIELNAPVSRVALNTYSNYLNKYFLQQHSSFLRRELTAGIERVGVCEIGEIEEQIETFDEGGRQGGGRHAVDQRLASHRQQVEGRQQHPARARFLRRLNLQELDDRTACLLWKG